jgi:RimJ/RimL family protein N-acetyltransferase
VGGFEYTAPIRTERLLLRAFEPADFDAVYAMRSNPDIVRLLYWGVQTQDEARAALEQKVAARALHAEGDVLSLAVVLTSTDEVVGDLLLHWVSREHGTAEVGFIAHPDHQGRGYTTEAARPLLRIAFEDLGLHRVIGRTEARNTASARVLEKLGMRREAHFVENEWVKGEWQSELVYAILDREWRDAVVRDAAARDAGIGQPTP